MGILDAVFSNFYHSKYVHLDYGYCTIYPIEGELDSLATYPFEHRVYRWYHNKREGADMQENGVEQKAMVPCTIALLRVKSSEKQENMYHE